MCVCGPARMCVCVCVLTVGNNQEQHRDEDDEGCPQCVSNEARQTFGSLLLH